MVDTFTIPRRAVKYRGLGLTRLTSLKSKMEAIQESRGGIITWAPIEISWFVDPRMISYCESSLTGHTEMFGKARHPFVGHIHYYEGVWIREYMSVPTSAIILFPYLSSKADPVVYTIGVYNSDWVESVITTYANGILEIIGIATTP